jgi:SAM-dependent methyltransferase
MVNSSGASDSDLFDPVSAYERIAPVFARLVERNKAYCDAVDRFVISQIPAGSQSLLDVGAGDGSRARCIGRAVGLTRITLLEPSAAMRRNYPAGVEVWSIRAEELHRMQGRFDVITCLWNVLGHIFPFAARVEVLRQFARLVSPGGVILADVIHRYNARQYGALPTAMRLLHDLVSPQARNGDVRVVWEVDGQRFATSGHVFTGREVRSMVQAGGLKIVNRRVIDYASGERRRWLFQGNLAYTLRPATGCCGSGG